MLAPAGGQAMLRARRFGAQSLHVVLRGQRRIRTKRLTRCAAKFKKICSYCARRHSYKRSDKAGMPRMAISGPDHFTILTSEMAKTRAFYADTLGLAAGPRPALPFAAQVSPIFWEIFGRWAFLSICAGCQRGAPQAACGRCFSRIRTGRESRRISACPKRRKIRC